MNKVINPQENYELRGPGFFRTILQLWNIFSKKRKKQFLLITLIMIVNGFMEVISLAALIPFLILLTRPDELLKYNFFKNLTIFNDINNYDNFFYLSSIIFLIAILLVTLIRIINLWCNKRFAAILGIDLNQILFRKILFQDYEEFLNQNSGNIINLVSKQTVLTVGFINFLLNIMTYFVVSIQIILGLLFFNPKISLVIFISAIMAYLFLGKTFQKQLVQNGIINFKRSEDQVKFTQETLGSFREITINNNQESFLKRFYEIDRPLKFSDAYSEFIAGSPKFLLEFVGIFFIIFVMIILTIQGDSLIIPTIGTFALAYQKLIPAINQIYSSWAQVKANNESVSQLLKFIGNDTKFRKNTKFKSYELKNEIILENIHYKYRENKEYIIRNFNLKITKGQCIGIKGKTGCGKTTLIDLIAGLLRPNKGNIMIDDKLLHSKIDDEFIYKWRSSIAHVPQFIFMIDASIIENIALGIAKSKINKSLAMKSAKDAQIFDFIDHLPEKFNTKVGERGIKLSGGQIQRIGIARALYKKANIIILDEATSALDVNTEEMVMNSFKKLNQKITLIIIAHRISTLKNCDKVIDLNESF